MRINEEQLNLWRTVDHEGDELEAYVTKARNIDRCLITFDQWRRCALAKVSKATASTMMMPMMICWT